MARALDITVRTIDLEQPPHVVSELARCLLPEETARAGRFHFEADRRRFTVARAALRDILGTRLDVAAEDVRFAYGPHGKPFLDPAVHPDESLHFNLSHARDRALCALCDGTPIGVDIECVDRDIEWEDLARRFFAPEETAAIFAEDASLRRAAFFRCWTRKEAYIKARGDGMTMGLSAFAVSVERAATPRLLRTGEGDVEAARWSLLDVSVEEGFSAAVAAASPNVRLDVSAWQPRT